MKKLFVLAAFLLSSASFLNPLPAATNTEPGDIVQMRGNVSVRSNEVRKNIVVLLGSIDVQGKVEGSAVSLLGDITIGPRGAISGDAVSIGGKIFRQSGGVVGRREVSLSIPVDSIEEFLLMSAPVMATVMAAALGMAAALSSVGFIALVVLVLIFFEKQAETARQELQKHPIACFVVGLLAFGSVLPILTFLTLTIIGIPLAFIAAVVAVAALILGLISVGFWLGKNIAAKFGKTFNPIWSGVLGFFVLALLGLVPLVGWLIQVCALIMGFGAATRTRFRSTIPQKTI